MPSRLVHRPRMIAWAITFWLIVWVVGWMNRSPDSRANYWHHKYVLPLEAQAYTAVWGLVKAVGLSAKWVVGSMVSQLLPRLYQYIPALWRYVRDMNISDVINMYGPSTPYPQIGCDPTGLEPSADRCTGAFLIH